MGIVTECVGIYESCQFDCYHVSSFHMMYRVLECIYVGFLKAQIFRKIMKHPSNQCLEAHFYIAVFERFLTHAFKRQNCIFCLYAFLAMDLSVVQAWCWSFHKIHFCCSQGSISIILQQGMKTKYYPLSHTCKMKRINFVIQLYIQLFILLTLSLIFSFHVPLSLILQWSNNPWYSWYQSWDPHNVRLRLPVLLQWCSIQSRWLQYFIQVSFSRITIAFRAINKYNKQGYLLSRVKYGVSIHVSFYKLGMNKIYVFVMFQEGK